MESQPIQTDVEEGKTIAIIAYITLIGLIIAFIMNTDKKNSFAAYHIRQSLGIVLTAIVLSVVAGIVGISTISWIFNLIILAAWILGLISAVQGERKPIPVLGLQFQEWFKGIG